MLHESVPYSSSGAGSVVRDRWQGLRFGRLGLRLRTWLLHRRYVVGILALAAVYYGAARLGFALQFSGPVAAVVWLPSGVGIAFLTVGGLRYWPGVLVGDLLVNGYAQCPLGPALGVTGGNMVEVLVGALLIRRLAARGSPLDSLGGIARLLAAIAAAAAISATVGSLALRAGGVVSGSGLPEVARTWWLGDATGALILIPLALAWYQPPVPGWARSRGVEGVLMLAAVVGASEIAFRSESPLAYLVFPVLGWAALRFGRRGATLAVAVAAGFAVWKTTHYHGPFVYDSITLSVLTTQVYIVVVAVWTLCLAALVLERKRFAEGLDASRARLVKASDTERRRLERNLHDGAQQHLTALAVRLGLAADLAREAHEPGAAALDEAKTELELVIDELRELSQGIHPSVLSDLGLGQALKVLVRRSSVPTAFVNELPAARFDDTVEATAYYVVAEALTNAQKHAHASSVRVRASATRRMLCIEIADDGIGGANASPGGGIIGLRDRVEAVGGTFDLDSIKGNGTRIAAAIPQHRPRP